MSRRPGLMNYPLLEIRKPEISATLEDWYNYFYKLKTKEMTLQFESVKEYMMHYYSFLQKDQIVGRCYDFLSIPNVMGKINKSKFSKLLKEKQASRKRKLDIKITKNTGPNVSKNKKINQKIFIDSEEDSEHSVRANIKILKATETKKKKTRPLIFNESDHFDRESVYSVRKNIEITEANNPNEPKKRKASPKIFEDPKTFQEASYSVGANNKIANDNNPNEPIKRKASPTIFEDHPETFEEASNSVETNNKIANDKRNEPKKRKTSPPIFDKSDYFEEDSLSSGNDYDTGMLSPTDSFKVNDETGTVQEKRLEIDRSDDSLELGDDAAHLERPLEEFKRSITPIGRIFKPSESDSSVFEEDAELNCKQVRFKENVDFQSLPVAVSDSEDSTDEPCGFIEAMTKKEEFEKVEREIGRIEFTKLKLDDSESEYSEIQMGFLQYKKTTSTHSEPSMEIDQDSPIDKLSMKKHLLIKGNYRFDANKTLISQEISYTENTRGRSSSPYLFMKFLKNANNEPIVKDEDPMKLILSLTDEMNMTENLGDDMRKLQIVSPSSYEMHSTANLEETMDSETSHDPSTFKKIQTSENSDSDPSTDYMDQFQTSFDGELSTTNDIESDFKSDSSFSSQPSMISSTVILPGFKFL